MATYNEQIAKDDSLELVMMSRDKDVSKALEWAKKENFPWPTIMKVESDKHSGDWDFFKKKQNVVPFYMLIDGDGNVLATDKKTAFEKAGLK